MKERKLERATASRSSRSSDAAAAFRFMQQAKHIGKVVLSMAEQPAMVSPGDDPVTFQADASYLITGGLGGFGMATARWMVQHGARNLILAGRRGSNTDDTRGTIAELESLGVRVMIAKVDVTSEEDVARMLAMRSRGSYRRFGAFSTQRWFWKTACCRISIATGCTGFSLPRYKGPGTCTRRRNISLSITSSCSHLSPACSDMLVRGTTPRQMPSSIRLPGIAARVICHV